MLLHALNRVTLAQVLGLQRPHMVTGWDDPVGSQMLRSASWVSLYHLLPSQPNRSTTASSPQTTAPAFLEPPLLLPVRGGTGRGPRVQNFQAQQLFCMPTPLMDEWQVSLSGSRDLCSIQLHPVVLLKGLNDVMCLKQLNGAWSFLHPPSQSALSH